MSDRFADELLRELADFPAARDRVAAVLRKWGGQRVYVPSGPLRRGETAADLARTLVFSGVGRSAAVAILAQRRGLSARHARRLVGAAVAMRGQAVSASPAKMGAFPRSQGIEDGRDQDHARTQAPDARRRR